MVTLIERIRSWNKLPAALFYESVAAGGLGLVSVLYIKELTWLGMLLFLLGLLGVIVAFLLQEASDDVVGYKK